MARNSATSSYASRPIGGVATPLALGASLQSTGAQQAGGHQEQCLRRVSKAGPAESLVVIPGRALWREPRIHTSDRGYGFSGVQLHIKARRSALPRNDGSEDVSRAATTFFERKAAPTGGRRTARSTRSKARSARSSARSADVHRIFNPTRRFQMRPRLRQCYDASGVVA